MTNLAKNDSTDVPAEVAAADPTPPAAIDPRLLVRQDGIKGYIDEFRRKVRGGELGSLPVVVGLIVIWVVFQSQSSLFLSAGNLGNIVYFLAATGMLSIGLVFVLILGEIDLSVASVSGLSAAVFGVVSVTHQMSPWLALVLAILTGTVIGALHGWIFARIGVPAFVVTLAGNLGWNGAMLWLLSNGSINLKDSGPLHYVSQRSFFLDSDIAGGYILAAIGVASLLGGALLEQSRRRKAEVPYRPTAEIAMRAGVLAVISLVAVYVLNQANGIPNAMVIFLAALMITDFVLRRTTYGRQVFAVGGSIEAARRAGINVAWIRISVFAISGSFAALGGLFIAAQIMSANQGAGTGNLLMLAIAAAVIGGTSLFGGRGKTWSALLGMLVIQSITTGLNLLSMDSSVQYMITGGVLLGAVIIDSVSRKTQKASGRG